MIEKTDNIVSENKYIKATIQKEICRQIFDDADSTWNRGKKTNYKGFCWKVDDGVNMGGRLDVYN